MERKRTVHLGGKTKGPGRKATAKEKRKRARREGISQSEWSSDNSDSVRRGGRI